MLGKYDIHDTPPESTHKLARGIEIEKIEKAV